LNVVLALGAVLVASGFPAAAETVLGLPGDRVHANLGVSLAADGDRIAAGAPGYWDTAVEGGAVAIFRREAGAWVVDRILETLPVP